MFLAAAAPQLLVAAWPGIAHLPCRAHKYYDPDNVDSLVNQAAVAQKLHASESCEEQCCLPAAAPQLPVATWPGIAHLPRTRTEGCSLDSLENIQL